MRLWSITFQGIEDISYYALAWSGIPKNMSPDLKGAAMSIDKVASKTKASSAQAFVET
jgi:hypothetical protein